MPRRALFVLLLGAILTETTGNPALAAGDVGKRPPPPAAARPDPEARQRAFDAWWARQQEREAADRFWNGPREHRRNLTRDQIEFWERRKERHQRTPSWPF